MSLPRSARNSTPAVRHWYLRAIMSARHSETCTCFDPVPCDGPSEWLACSEQCAKALRRTIRQTLAYGGYFGGGAPPEVRVAEPHECGQCYECDCEIRPHE